MKVLHKSAVVFEELRLIPQKNATVRKQAGESRGVALLSLRGSQRTATPTAPSFLRFRTQGLQTRKTERFGVEDITTADNKGVW